MGRGSSGVKGIEIEENEIAIGAEVINDEQEQVLIVTENGYGKKTPISEYRKTHKGNRVRCLSYYSNND